MSINMFNLTKLALQDDLQCFLFLRDHGLAVSHPRCEFCDKETKMLVKSASQVVYQCRKQTGDKHTFHVNALKGTFFENCHFGLRNILIFCYYFSVNQTNYDFLMHECSVNNTTISRHTIAEWMTACREICFAWLDENVYREKKLGGKGVVVEIEECIIGKRKNKKGRLEEGMWVLGMMEVIIDGSKRGGRYRFELCPNNERSAEVLIPLILKHVHPDTTIVADFLWKSNFKLTENGLVNFIINNSENPKTEGNAPIFESLWRKIKRRLKSSIRSELIADHLFEYLYRREVRMANADPFAHFLNALKSW